MPLLFITYILQFLDKTSLNTAAILGIIQETVRSSGCLHSALRLLTRQELTMTETRRPRISLAEQCVLLWLSRCKLPRVYPTGQAPHCQVSLRIDVSLVCHNPNRKPDEISQ